MLKGRRMRYLWCYRDKSYELHELAFTPQAMKWSEDRKRFWVCDQCGKVQVIGKEIA